MKLYKYIPTLILAALASCELEKNPISEVSSEDYFNNADEIATGLVACYHGLQEPMRYEWQLTEMRSDNARIETFSSTTAATITNIEFDRLTVSTTNTAVNDYWQATYKNIANCNTILDAMDVVGDADERNELEGQALFIRGYHYFNLVRLFGPVLIVDRRITADEALSYERKSVEEVYEFIINDLKRAESMLENVVYEANQEARVTKWSAKALLGKVYMTLQDYSSAAVYLNDVISNSGHKQLGNYADVFSITNECNEEILFTVRFTSGGIGLGSPFGNWFAPAGSGNAVINNDGSSWNYPTSTFRDAFTITHAVGTTPASYDSRKDVCVRDGYINTSLNWVEDPYVNKYMSQVSIDEDGNDDWPIIRYTDVVLMYAEAINEISGPSAAEQYINPTRIRGGRAPISSSDYSTKNDMRQLIAAERRLEFAFENQRWFDLVRTGRAVDVINDMFDTYPFYASENDDVIFEDITEADLLLPIPQEVIDANSNITQNAGY